MMENSSPRARPASANIITGRFSYQKPAPLIASRPSTAQSTRPGGRRPGGRKIRGAFPGRSKPKWLKYDRQVLRYHLYFKEAVNESRLENYRIRKVTLYYYLEDDTIHMAEPKQVNSGLPQGMFLKRQQIFKSDGTLYKPADIVVGTELTLNSRTFKCVDMDAKTRKYLTEEAGVEAGEALPYPSDRYMQILAKAKVHPVQKSNKVDTLKRFLDNDRKVLRFYCMWDDTATHFGTIRKFILHYFLADNTLEVREVYGANCGRDPYPLLLSRKPLIKRNGQRLLANEIVTGTAVNIYGRNIVPYDCDPFTRRYYQSFLGITQETISVDKPKSKPKRMPIPPYNGYGSDKDSLGSFFNLVPKKPKPNFAKLDEYGKKVLRFSGKLALPSAEDAPRTFIIAYWLADDTISVFEPTRRNSGFVGGKYLERGQYRNIDAKGKKDISGRPRLFSTVDFFIGANLTIEGRSFTIMGCDSFTKAYMTGEPEKFPLSKLDRIYNKMIRAFTKKRVSVRNMFKDIDTDNSGYIELAEFRELLEKTGVISTDPAEDEEIVTDEEVALVMMKFGDGDDIIWYDEFCDAVASANAHLAADTGEKLDDFEHALLKKLREAKVHLRKLFRKFDADANGVLTADEFNQMLLTYNIQATKAEQNRLMRRYDVDGTGAIDYNEFCNKVYPLDFSSELENDLVSQNLLDQHEEAAKLTDEEYEAKLKREQEKATQSIEYSHLMKKFAMKVIDLKYKLLQKFRQNDADRDGKCTADEFLAVFNFYVPIVEADKFVISSESFPTGDETLDYMQFINQLHLIADSTPRMA
jgi:Ca2+-binding EF-hand superfamily protein